jgi:type II restriction/modification system DNA methylase subunit YeeA
MTRDIPFIEFSEFLSKKKIVHKKFEATRMCNSALREKLDPEGSFLLSQYQKVTSLALLRGALMNLWYYIRKIQVRDQ